MRSEVVPEEIMQLIQKIFFDLFKRRAKKSEIRSFYERLRLIRLGSLIRIVDRVSEFQSVGEEQKARLLLSNTASLLKKLSSRYDNENRFREAFEKLSIEFSNLYETIHNDPEFPGKLELLRKRLTEVDQAAEFYERIAKELKMSDDYIALLRSREVT